MRGIGDLVGIDADQARPYPGIDPAQVGFFPGRTAAAKGLAQDRRRPAEEFVAAADLHLDQQALALVQRHAARLADRLVAPGFRQAEFVERMAGFVRSEEHTSELQSLMRTSYAVFCLKKQTT